MKNITAREWKFMMWGFVIGFCSWVALLIGLPLLSDFIDQQARLENSQGDYTASVTQAMPSQEATFATTTATINGYTLEVVHADPAEPNWPNFIENMRVLKKDKVLFERNDEQASVMSFGIVDGVIKNISDWLGDWPDYEILNMAQDFATHGAIDVDEDGIPELAFIESDGGNGGGDHYKAFVIRLSNPISILLEQESSRGMSTFVNLGKGVLKIATVDTSFAYWETSGVSSPAEIVMLSLKNGKYVPDATLMRKVPPNDKDLEFEAAKWKDVDWGTKTGAICEMNHCIVPWAYALKLIYSGNAESAKKYIDLAYHNKSRLPFDSKEDFLKKFIEQIMKSPYYEDLAAYMNLKALGVSP